MKLNKLFLMLFAVAITLSSCKKDDIEHESDFEKSYKAFKNFQASSNNSYIYKVGFSSWTGYSSETTIKVEGGIVTGRSFVSKTLTHQPAPVTTIHEEWTEDKNALNSHAEGFSTMTLDDIYMKAKADWLLKRTDATTYFEAKNNGMISSCGYVPKGCMDDCFNGISILSINQL